MSGSEKHFQRDCGFGEGHPGDCQPVSGKLKPEEVAQSIYYTKRRCSGQYDCECDSVARDIIEADRKEAQRQACAPLEIEARRTREHAAAGLVWVAPCDAYPQASEPAYSYCKCPRLPVIAQACAPLVEALEKIQNKPSNWQNPQTLEEARAVAMAAIAQAKGRGWV